MCIRDSICSGAAYSNSHYLHAREYEYPCTGCLLYTSVFKVFGSFLKKDPLAKNPTVTLLSEKYAMKFIPKFAIGEFL